MCIVSRLGEHDRWAVRCRGCGRFAADATGELVHFVGGNWQSIGIEDIGALYASCGSDVWALGGTSIHHYDGAVRTKLGDGGRPLASSLGRRDLVGHERRRRRALVPRYPSDEPRSVAGRKHRRVGDAFPLRCVALGAGEIRNSRYVFRLIRRKCPGGIAENPYDTRANWAGRVQFGNVSAPRLRHRNLSQEAFQCRTQPHRSRSS